MMQMQAVAGGEGGGGDGTLRSVLYCAPAAAHRSSLGAPGRLPAWLLCA